MEKRYETKKIIKKLRAGKKKCSKVSISTSFAALKQTRNAAIVNKIRV